MAWQPVCPAHSCRVLCEASSRDLCEVRAREGGLQGGPLHRQQQAGAQNRTGFVSAAQQGSVTGWVGDERNVSQRGLLSTSSPKGQTRDMWAFLENPWWSADLQPGSQGNWLYPTSSVSLFCDLEQITNPFCACVFLTCEMEACSWLYPQSDD